MREAPLKLCQARRAAVGNRNRILATVSGLLASVERGEQPCRSDSGIHCNDKNCCRRDTTTADVTSPIRRIRLVGSKRSGSGSLAVTLRSFRSCCFGHRAQALTITMPRISDWPETRALNSSLTRANPRILGFLSARSRCYYLSSPFAQPPTWQESGRSAVPARDAGSISVQG